MKISLDVKTKYYIKQLGKMGNRLQITAAETLNESAEEIQQSYKKKLQSGKSIARNKFTLNAAKIDYSKPIRRSGEPRPLNQMNSIIGIRKMKGGKEHYLAKREEGHTQVGSLLTLGKVAVPLNTARTSNTYKKSIRKANRISEARPHKLKIKNKKVGVRNDGYNNTKRRWGAVYRAKNRGTLNYKPDRQFFMIDNKGKQGIFEFDDDRIVKIRKLEKSRARYKAKPDFERSIKVVSPTTIKQKFVKKAKKITF